MDEFFLLLKTSKQYIILLTSCRICNGKERFQTLDVKSEIEIEMKQSGG